jgi:2-haloacid dehalogenase
MRAAWIQRSPDAIFDPWGIEPTLTVDSLSGLADAVRKS